MLKKLFYCLILLLTFIIAIFLINKYFKPFFIVLLLLFLCIPLYNVFENKIKNKKINSFLCIISINVIIFFVIFSLGNFIIKNINEFFMHDYQKIYYVFENAFIKYGININILNNKIEQFYYSFLNSSSLKKGASFTSEWIFAYFVSNIIVYFILKDKKLITDHIMKFLPSDKAQKLLTKSEAFNKIFKIEIILVLLTTFETIIGFYILHIKSAFILGIICGILDILPYVGTFIVFLPLILYKILENDYIVAVALILFYILILIVRQMLEAKYISLNFKIHPLVLIISIYVGIKMCGFLGVFMGPLYIACAKELIFN